MRARFARGRRTGNECPFTGKTSLYIFIQEGVYLFDVGLLSEESPSDNEKLNIFRSNVCNKKVTRVYIVKGFFLVKGVFQSTILDLLD
jgi:hypothetical protein